MIKVCSIGMNLATHENCVVFQPKESRQYSQAIDQLTLLQGSNNVDLHWKLQAHLAHLVRMDLNFYEQNLSNSLCFLVKETLELGMVRTHLQSRKHLHSSACWERVFSLCSKHLSDSPSFVQLWHGMATPTSTVMILGRRESHIHLDSLARWERVDDLCWKHLAWLQARIGEEKTRNYDLLRN